jgi:hypothetical protein
MARVKNAMEGEGIPAEEEAASSQSVAADNSRKTLNVRVSDIECERSLSAPRGQQLAHMHPFRGGCLLGQLVQKSRL